MRLLLLLVSDADVTSLHAQQTIPLYEKEVPGMLPVESIEKYDSTNGHAFNVTNPFFDHLPAG